MKGSKFGASLGFAAGACIPHAHTQPHTHTPRKESRGFIVALCCFHFRGSGLPKHWEEGKKDP